MARILRAVLILATAALLLPACARRVTSPTNGVQTLNVRTSTPRAARPPLTEAEVTDVLQKVLAGLPQDLVQFTPPAAMNVGETARLEARMARALLEDVNKALLTKGWKVDALVGARLSGDGFEVRNLGIEDQMVGSQEFTAWSWDVTPLAPGSQVLRLHTTFRVVTSRGAQYKALPVFERTVAVTDKSAGGFLKFLQSYWAWILGIILVAGIVAILVVEPSNKSNKKT
jgi:hypothetical protein